MTDYKSLPTPESCYVDFCLIPVCLAPRALAWFRSASHDRDTSIDDRNSLTTYSTQIGTGNVSVASEIADVQRLLKASGLSYKMHSSGTTVGMFYILFCGLSFPLRNVVLIFPIYMGILISIYMLLSVPLPSSILAVLHILFFVSGHVDSYRNALAPIISKPMNGSPI